MKKNHLVFWFPHSRLFSGVPACMGLKRIIWLCVFTGTTLFPGPGLCFGKKSFGFVFYGWSPGFRLPIELIGDAVQCTHIIHNAMKVCFDKIYLKTKLAPDRSGFTLYFKQFLIKGGCILAIARLGHPHSF